MYSRRYWRYVDIWISTLKEILRDIWISTCQDIRRHPGATGAVIPNQDGAGGSLVEALELNTTPRHSAPDSHAHTSTSTVNVLLRQYM